MYYMKLPLIALVAFLATTCGPNNSAESGKVPEDNTKDLTNANNGNSPAKAGDGNFQSSLPLERIELPEGFKVTTWAENVEGARSMAWGDKGTLFVGTRDDKVYALRDEDKDGHAEKLYTIAQGMSMPNGVAFRNGSLYVAEVSKVWRYDDIENQLSNPSKPALVSDKFPDDKHHGWKYIAFGPDDMLYVPVGAPCNICERDYNEYSNIMRMKPDGSGLEMYAKGIRNTVGFDWHPVTNELWFTDNGRDMMGDNIPPDELNRAPRKDMHFGYPYCHGNDIKDPKFGDAEHPCSKYVKPAQLLGPHVAALGMKFYDGTQFPQQYRNQVFIAEHGSWNRSSKLGYRVMLVKLDANGNALSYEPFATGWLQGEEAWGRPVDVLLTPDGSLLVSDDHANAIYRIYYEG